MRSRWRRGFWVAVATCWIAVAAAGAKTKIVESAQDGQPQEAPARKLLVLAVTKDPITRATFEDVTAGELSLRGATAVASNRSFSELPKEREPFEAKLASEGFDAVLVSRVVGQDDKVTWKEGMTSYSPSYLGQGYWGGYWYTYQQVFIPGYLAKETRVRVRTDLWRMTAQGGRLVWSGTSETLDPLTVPRAAREVGAAVAKALAKAKLI